MRYIRSRRDEFEPFLDEDEPFDEYGESGCVMLSCHVYLSCDTVSVK